MVGGQLIIVSSHAGTALRLKKKNLVKTSRARINQMLLLAFLEEFQKSPS